MIFVYGLCIFTLLLYYHGGTATGAATEKLIPFDDGNIRYFGRWQATGTDMRSSWPGSYFKTNFYGTQIKLRLNEPASVHVQLDQRPVREFQATGEAPIELDIAPPDLSDGHHELLVASSAADNTTLRLESLALAIAGDMAPPTNVSPVLVEFVGHDLSLGIGSSQVIPTSFPWLVSNMLGIEHAQIAYRDAWLMDRPGVRGMETRYFSWSPDVDGEWWDFSNYVPSAIVILLGQNDIYEEEYDSALMGFLKRVRSHFPYASLLVLSEPLGDLVRQSQHAVYQLNDQGDQDIYFVDTTGWLQHGSNAFSDFVSWAKKRKDDPLN